MKRLIVLVPLVLLIWLSLAHAISYNGVQPGGAGSATPVAVGTSTPVKVMACGSGAQYIKFIANGGTAGTDGCYVTVSNALSSPCAAATPAPNASTKVGDFIPTGGGSPLIYNYPSQTGATFISGEWDAVCTAASMTVSVVTIP